MPVYNGDEYLQEAIASILNQTYTDFEFLIIDDASLDKSVDVICGYSDNRIRLIRNKRNLGISKTLNRGLRLARGKYVARMDADDISHPERLQAQITFLDEHPSIGLCGTSVTYIGDYEGVCTVPESHEAILARMVFSNILPHPTIVLRMDLLSQHALQYDEFCAAEDYDLWIRLSKFTRFANINSPLLRYRLHQDSISKTGKKRVDYSAMQIRHKQLLNMGVQPDRDELKLHNSIAYTHFKIEKAYVRAVHEWFLKIQKINRDSGFVSDLEFSKVLAEYWYRVCLRARSLGPWVAWQFWYSPLRLSLGFSWQREFAFLWRCILKK